MAAARPCRPPASISNCEAFAFPGMHLSDLRAERRVYICICNALTDGDIHRAATDGGARRPAEVFHACRRRAQCGTCVRKLRDLLMQTVGGPAAAAASAVPSGDLAEGEVAVAG